MNIHELIKLERAASKGPWETMVWMTHSEFSVIEHPATGPCSDVLQPGWDMMRAVTYNPPENEQKENDNKFMVAIRNDATKLFAIALAAQRACEAFTELGQENTMDTLREALEALHD